MVIVKVTDNIWRGSQPAAGDWGGLAALGIMRVLKLNGDSRGSLPATVPEGLIVHDVSLQDFDDPSLELDEAPILAAHAALTSHPGPWLVHCTEGKDRTGVVIARYRVLCQGWTKEAAFAEWWPGSNRYRQLEEYWKGWTP